MVGSSDSPHHELLLTLFLPALNGRANLGPLLHERLQRGFLSPTPSCQSSRYPLAHGSIKPLSIQLAKHGCTDACLIRSSRLFHATVASPSHTCLDSSSPDYLRTWRRGEFAPRHHRNSLAAAVAADGLRTFPRPPAEER